MAFDLSQTDRLLTTTRSVRKRLDLTRPVERATVLECLDIALQAPTGGNTQRWRWLVIDDPDVRTRIAEMYRRSWGPDIAERRKGIAAARGPPDNAIGHSATDPARHPHAGPVHVIP